MTPVSYHRRITDRPRRSASLTRRTLDCVLFAAMVLAFVWFWTGAGGTP